MDLELGGKKALITGGSKGIGLAVGKVLLAEGCDLVLVSRNINHASVTDALGAHAANRITTIQADLSQPGVAESLGERFPSIDILVNNAGAVPGGSLQEIDEKTWRAAWDLKVFGYTNMCRVFYPILQRKGGGTIVNIAGIGAVMKSPRAICISMGNAAIVVLSQALGSTSHLDNIRVAAINPGPIETERYVEVNRAVGEKKMRNDAHLPFSRPGKTEEIGWAVAFLASERSGYTSGAVVTIDGGMTASLQNLGG